MKAIAALRNQFGGHAVLAETEDPVGDQPVEPPAGGRAHRGPRWPASPERRPGAVRRHRRPGPQEDLPGRLRDGARRAGWACRSSAWRRRSGTTTTSASAPTTPSVDSVGRRHRRVAVGRPRPAADLRERRLPRGEHVRDDWRTAEGRRAAAVLPGHPAGHVRRRGARAWRRRAAPAGTPGGGREALRARPGVGRASSTTCSTRCSPRRRSSGSTTSSGRSRSRTCWSSGSPTRCSSRCGTATTSTSVQITMAEEFGVEGRGRFYESVGRPPRRVRRTTCCRWWRCWRWSRRSRPTRTRSATRRCACGARSGPSTRRRSCGASTGATSTSPASSRAATSRPTWRSSSRSIRGGGPACRGWSARARTCRSPPPRPWSRSRRRPACCSRVGRSPPRRPTACASGSAATTGSRCTCRPSRRATTS